MLILANIKLFHYNLFLKWDDIILLKPPRAMDYVVDEKFKMIYHCKNKYIITKW